MEWLKIPKSSAVVKFACLDNFEQEPYFIVKLTPTTPVYDERFIDYGFNKIQYFEHLRCEEQSYILFHRVLLLTWSTQSK